MSREPVARINTRLRGDDLFSSQLEDDF